jgi:hypothetical protein
MSVHQVRSARRKMILRYGGASRARSVAEAMAAEARKAERARAAAMKRKK